MKLLFVSQVPDTRLMGVPRVLYSIGDELQARGHTVDYFYEDDGPQPLVKRMALMEWSLRATPQIAERCQREQYDAVVITTLSGWALSTFRKLLGIPPQTRIISWHHGWEELLWEQLMIEERGGHVLSGRFKWYYGTVILWAIRQSLKTQDGAIFTSTEECDWVKAKHPKQAGKIYFQPNGVGPEFYDPARYDRPAPQAVPHLLFLGYWDPWRKGRKYLVDAFSQLHERYPEVRLTLAGTKLGADDILPDFPGVCRGNVTVIPHVSQKEAIALYQSHDIFVLSALFEGMPLVVLEAMAAGMPVVTSNSNGMKDLITDGRNGRLIERRDVRGLVAALSQLIEDPALRQAMGTAAYETVRDQFTWGRVTDQFEANLHHIMQNSPERTT